MAHVPVMAGEVVRFLRPCDGGIYIDATLGGGGHARAILEACPSAVVVGLDADPAAVAAAAEKLKDFAGRFSAVSANFRDIGGISRRFGRADGLVADLGISSDQLADSSRGFSFDSTGPLDMRINPAYPVSAAEVLEKFPPDEIERIFREYGGERHSRRLARAVAQRRERGGFASAADFARLASATIPRGAGRIHPATRAFQALRIYVNSELDNLAALLGALPSALKPGGRAVLISFHSGEDAVVKRFFAAGRSEGFMRALTKKPLRPSDEEVALNPRSRSAKLRAAEML